MEFYQIDIKGQFCLVGLLNVGRVCMLGKITALSRLDE